MLSCPQSWAIGSRPAPGTPPGTSKQLLLEHHRAGVTGWRPHRTQGHGAEGPILAGKL